MYLLYWFDPLFNVADGRLPPPPPPPQKKLESSDKLVNRLTHQKTLKVS